MAEVKKMSHSVAEDGTITFKFAHGEEVSFNPANLPESVRNYQLTFGALTAARNSTISSKEEGTVGTPESMAARMKAKIAQWEQGILRVSRASGEERPAASTKLLEAALIYRQAKAAARGEECFDTIESLRPLLDDLDAQVVNPDAAEAEQITKLDQLKATKAFKAAWDEAGKRRAEAKAKASAGALAEDSSDF